MSLAELLSGPRPVLIGVVHCLATPGSPRHASMEALLARAAADARALVEGGVDALLVENYGDVPFHAAGVPSETIAALALALRAVQAAAGARPVGVNVLRNDARAALGLCAATGASFLRVNVHTGTMASDQGLLEGRAAETLRERARLAPGVLLLADAHVKHATPLGSESLVEAARDAVERGLADAVIVSGRRTGAAPAAAELREVRAAVAVPVLVGSGLAEENAGELLAHAHGAIVGSALERGGRAGEPVEAERVQRMRQVADQVFLTKTLGTPY